MQGRFLKRFNKIQKPHAYVKTYKRYEHGQFFKNNSLGQFYQVKTTPALAASLEKASSLKDEIYQKKLKINSNLQEAINNKLHFLWIYNSNALEGSRLTLEDTIFFLQEGLTVSGKSLKDFFDANNHLEAINYLYKTIHGQLSIDPNLLCALNVILLKKIDFIHARYASGQVVQKKLHPGQYKKESNHVLQPDGSIHKYVEPFQVSSQIHDLCEWIDSNMNEKHPIITASIAHYNKVRIHPFQDGNGRGARMLMNLILMYHKFPPAIIEVNNKKNYLDCLKIADQGDLLPFTQYIADSVNKTQELVLKEIDIHLNKNRLPAKLSNSSPKLSA